MKIKELSERFQVSMTTLRYYEKVGLLDEVQRVHQIREYNDDDIRRLSLIISLKKAGLQIEDILKYIQLSQSQKDTLKERVCILKKRRYELLDEIHFKQKSLDELDCMIYQMKGECS